MDNRQIDVAITTYNRFAETLESFVQVSGDSRIKNIILSDDFSDESIYKQMKTAVSFCPKVKLYRNLVNYGCYLNKRHAVSLCEAEFLCLFDSDNQLTKEYLDKVFEQEWDENTILAPDYAMPNFSYQAFGGLIVEQYNVSEYMDRPMFSTALNTCNFVVNRKRYLEVFDDTIDPIVCDSIYFNYCWLKSGGRIHITKGLQYPHLVHDGSHYKNNVHLTPKHLLGEIEDKLRQLK